VDPWRRWRSSCNYGINSLPYQEKEEGLKVTVLSDKAFVL
jgi:hypothetical protein